MSYQEHTQKAKHHVAKVAVITCSDTRTEENDTSGAFILQSVRDAGHEVVSSVIVREDPGLLLHSLETAVKAGASIVLINGGTGCQSETTRSRPCLGCWSRPYRALVSSLGLSPTKK